MIQGGACNSRTFGPGSPDIGYDIAKNFMEEVDADSMEDLKKMDLDKLYVWSTKPDRYLYDFAKGHLIWYGNDVLDRSPEEFIEDNQSLPNVKYAIIGGTSFDGIFSPFYWLIPNNTITYETFGSTWFGSWIQF